MGLVQESNKAAFGELYDRYASKLLGFMMRILGGDKQRAEDLLQDVFMKVIERPHMFDCSKKFASWLFTVAANTCKNEFRKINRDQESGIKEEHFMPLFENGMEASVDHRTFRQEFYVELGTLEDIHKCTFILRHRNEFSIREISEIMECSEGTVKSRLFYASKKLALRLKDFKNLR